MYIIHLKSDSITLFYKRTIPRIKAAVYALDNFFSTVHEINKCLNSNPSRIFRKLLLISETLSHF